MPRCDLARPLLAGAALCLALPALAQLAPSRPFPATALRGELVVTQPPEALLNGRPVRLSPGSRLRGDDNLIHTPASVAGRKLLVHYTTDLQGNVHDVWVLSAAEAARQPWPATPAQAAAWRFDPVAQTWSKP